MPALNLLEVEATNIKKNLLDVSDKKKNQY